MKKTVFIFLAAMSCMAFASCSGNSGKSSKSDKEKTVERSFSDLYEKNWKMSAACPKDWHYYALPLFDNIILFTPSETLIPSDENVPEIQFMGYAKMGLEHSATLEGDPVSYTVNGRTWEGAYNRESMEAELFTIIAGDKEGEDLIVDVKSKGVEPGGELFQQVLSGFKISGD